MNSILKPLIFFLALSLNAQSLAPWDHAFFNHRNDSLIFLSSQSVDGETDLAVTVNRTMDSHWTVRSDVIVSSRDQSEIGALFTRPDLPVIHTGRFISGELNYTGEQFKMRIGRLFPDYHPVLQVTPYAKETISGDGIDWSYRHSFWQFENRIEFLRPEMRQDHSISRIFNAHFIHLMHHNWEIGLGEYLIYTGDNKGVDWIWSNPFIPYIVHNFDAYSGIGTTTTEYNGDTDNSMLYGEFRWQGIKASIVSRLYVDEFQVDGADRITHTDEYLWHTQLVIVPTSLSVRASSSVSNATPTHNFELIFTAAFASASFGYHPGFFTTYYVDQYSLLPHESGRTRYAALSLVWQQPGFYVIADLWDSSYKNPLILMPDQRHLHDYVDSLPSVNYANLRLRAGRDFGTQTVAAADLGISGQGNQFTLSFIRYFDF